MSRCSLIGGIKHQKKKEMDGGCEGISSTMITVNIGRGASPVAGIRCGF